MLNLHLHLRTLPLLSPLPRLALLRTHPHRRLIHIPPPPDPNISANTSPKSDSTNPTYPAFSLQGLGMSKPIKIVVIAILTVFGTMESVFWAKLLWAKISPPAAEVEGEGEGKEKA
jgi:hypothetical protein